MSLSRPAFALAVALLAAAPSTAAAEAKLQLSAAGKRALKPLTLSTGTLGVTGATISPSSATLTLNGTLRFKSGRRSVSATALTATVGRTSASVSARLGKKRLRLLNVKPVQAPQLDAARRAVSLTGARVALTPAAAKALRSALKLKRTPSTATLGKLSLSIAPPASSMPVLAPVPSPAATATPAATPTATVTPEPTPTATVTPGPNLACADRFAVTPSAVVDWFGCDLPGSSDLKSWTNYLQSGVLFPCGGPPGSIVAGFGASQVVAGDVYDHRFPVLSTSTGADGSTTVVLGGHVRYRMPAHGIDEQLGSLRLVIPANGQTGTVYADGHSKTFDMSPTGCTAAPTPYAGVPVLTLDFTGIAPVTAGGVQRWIKVPATIAPGHALIGGGNYAAGSAWGFFTIAVPVR